MVEQFIGTVMIMAEPSPPGSPVPLPTLTLRGNEGELLIGVLHHGGALFIRNNAGINTIQLRGNSAKLQLGTDFAGLDAAGPAGELDVRDEVGRQTIRLLGGSGQIRLGIPGKAGELIVRDDDGDTTIELDGKKGRITLGGEFSGDPVESGEVVVNNHNGSNTIVLRGTNLSDPQGTGGEIHVRNLSAERDLVHIAPGPPGSGVPGGMITVKDFSGTEVIQLLGALGSIRLGNVGQDGDVVVRNSQGDTTIHLDGASGQVITANADCAEEFERADGDAAGQLEPGTVVVFDQDARLRESTEAYDRKVAGIVSGAFGRHPGITLGRRPDHAHHCPVALAGKVYCKVDAGFGPIEVGDLLTTSTTPGHAMKVGNPLQAFGAVIGKALAPWREGRGLIPTLVWFQ